MVCFSSKLLFAAIFLYMQGWGENDRGVSFVFGADVVHTFLETHDLDLVVRAHQVVEDGYEFFAGKQARPRDWSLSC